MHQHDCGCGMAHAHGWSGRGCLRIGDHAHARLTTLTRPWEGMPEVCGFGTQLPTVTRPWHSCIVGKASMHAPPRICNSTTPAAHASDLGPLCPAGPEASGSTASGGTYRRVPAAAQGDSPAGRPVTAVEIGHGQMVGG